MPAEHAGDLFPAFSSFRLLWSIMIRPLDVVLASSGGILVDCEKPIPPPAVICYMLFTSECS
jgi:hypothetical protein